MQKYTLHQNARREAITVLAVFAVALIWTLSFCYLNGYHHDPQSWVVQSGLARQRTGESPQHILGIPDWVLVGIVLPWLMCAAFTVGFCLGMKDDDLGHEAEDESEGEVHVR